MDKRSDDKIETANCPETPESSLQSPDDEQSEMVPSQPADPSKERLSSSNAVQDIEDKTTEALERSDLKGDPSIPATCDKKENITQALSKAEGNTGAFANQPYFSGNDSQDGNTPSDEDVSKTEDNFQTYAHQSQNSKNQLMDLEQRIKEPPMEETPKAEHDLEASANESQNSKRSLDSQQEVRKPLKEEHGLDAEGDRASSNQPQKFENQSKDLQQRTRQASSEEGLIECPDTINPDPVPPKGQRMDREPEVQNPESQIPYIPSTNIGVAILVTICFNLPFGVLAMYFSLTATKAFRDGYPKKGEKKARISVYISLFSIVLTVLIVMAIVLMKAMEGQSGRRRYATKTSVSF